MPINKLDQIESMLINQMKRMTFNPAIDCRNDLINCYGFSTEYVNSLSDNEVFAILDNMDDQENDSNEYKEILPVDCKCGHNEMVVIDFYDVNDSYLLKCEKCNHEGFIHYTGYDCILEGMEEYNK